jgi:transcriptional regulator with GAF, ATPase, and Fis domain
VFDLASAAEVRIVDRLLPEEAREARDEWREECERALEMWQFDRASMIDYIEIGRTRCIEVYDPAAAVASTPLIAPIAPIVPMVPIAIRMLPQLASVGACAALDDDRVDTLKRLYIRAPPGAGLTSWLRLVAREARHRGFIPLCPRVLARWPEVFALLRDRSIVLLCDRVDADADADAVANAVERKRDGLSALAAKAPLASALLTLSRARVRVCAVVCPAPARAEQPALHLGPHPVRTLAQAVLLDGRDELPASRTAATAASRVPAFTSLEGLEALAREADGLPGRYVTQLLMTTARAAAPRAAPPQNAATVPRADAGAGAGAVDGLLRVAEAAAAYALAIVPERPNSAPDPDEADMRLADAWNLHGRHASVLRDADALITRGRWAAAIRTLRAGVAAHHRRGVPQSAAVAALALARLSLLRCEIAEAERWCREAGELAARAPDEILAADALHWAGIIAIENADLEAGDRWLRMALIAAEQQGHLVLQQHIELSLARCLFWQGCIQQMPTSWCARAPAQSPHARAVRHRGESETSRESGSEGEADFAALPPLLRARAQRLAARRHLARGELSEAAAMVSAAAETIDALSPDNAHAKAAVNAVVHAVAKANADTNADKNATNADAIVPFEHRLLDHEKRDWVSALHVDRAKLQLAIGDRAQCEHHLDAAAAQKPTPARLARIRLVQMECDVLEQSQTDDTRRRIARLGRVFLQPRMPRLLRLRARYLIEPAARRSAELARFIDRYGESALAGRVHAGRRDALEATQFRALLQMSHEPGDERAVLARICAFVREQLAAAYVAIHAGGGATATGPATPTAAATVAAAAVATATATAAAAATGAAATAAATARATAAAATTAAGATASTPAAGAAPATAAAATTGAARTASTPAAGSTPATAATAAAAASAGYPLLASSGQSRLASAPLVERVIDTGLYDSPKPAADALEAGAPVQANGETIGALVSRWIIDRTIDRPLAAMLLPAAADATAPHVRAILDRGASSASGFESGFGSASAAASALASSSPSKMMGRNASTNSMLGVSSQIVRLRETIARAADAPFHVLIEGESGSGKELVARALHQQSVRRIRRFCAVNCAALTDDLLEAELFGHARGAFTGALAERIGLFEEAHEGTLFLDEVGELSPRAQAKLLRAIQDGEIRRLGENLPRRVQPRIVAATNRKLRDEADAGRFRADLLYRLDVVRIAVPPLRDRVEDVPVLARAFWQHALTRTGSRATLDPETLAALARYDWPGNVRELQNVIARLAVHAPTRGRVDPYALPPPIRPAAYGSTTSAEAAAQLPPEPLDRARRAFEEQFVRAALARAGGQTARAARDLGVTRQGLTKLLARLGIAAAEEPSTIDMNTKAALDAYVESDTDLDR